MASRAAKGGMVAQIFWCSLCDRKVAKKETSTAGPVGLWAGSALTLILVPFTCGLSAIVSIVLAAASISESVKAKKVVCSICGGPVKPYLSPEQKEARSARLEARRVKLVETQAQRAVSRENRMRLDPTVAVAAVVGVSVILCVAIWVLLLLLLAV